MNMVIQSKFDTFFLIFPYYENTYFSLTGIFIGENLLLSNWPQTHFWLAALLCRFKYKQLKNEYFLVSVYTEKSKSGFLAFLLLKTRFFGVNF